MRAEGQPLANYVAFSPDGRQVIFACRDGTAQTWSLESGKRLQVFRHAREPVSLNDYGLRFAVFSPSGQQVMTRDRDGSVRFWDAKNGAALGELRHPWERSRFDSVTPEASFSPDGRWLVTMGGADGRFGEVRLWDVATGEAIFPTMANASGFESATFSPDGSKLLTVAGDHTARLWWLGRTIAASAPFQHGWDALTAQSLARGLEEPAGPEELKGYSNVTHAVFSPDGGRLLSVSDNGSARIWDAITGRPLTPFVSLDRPLEGAAFTPDGSRIATVGGIFLTKDERWHSRSMLDPANALKEGVVRVWDARTGEPVTDVIWLDKLIRWTSFSPDGRWLIARARGAAWVLDARTGQPANLPMKLGSSFHAIAFSPQGGLVAVCSGRGRAGEELAKPETRVWNLSNGQPATPPLQGAGEISQLHFSPDGGWLVTVECDTNAVNYRVMLGNAAVIRAWNAATGQPISRALRPQQSPFSPLPRPNDEFPTLRLCSDSSRLFVFTQDGLTLAWDVAQGRELDLSHLQIPRSRLMAASADGRRMASLSDGQLLVVLDADTGQPLTPPLRARGKVETVGFSPDGGRLLALGGDWAQVWETPKETRSVEVVTQHAQLLSGRQFDGKARIVPLLAGASSNLWHSLRSRDSASFGFDPKQLRAWHKFEADRAEKEQHWFAAAFHLEQLLKDQSQDEALLRRLRRAHLLAASEDQP